MVRKNRLLLDLPLPSLPPCRLFPGCRPFPGFVQALFLGYSCASRISLWLFPDSLRGLRGILWLFPAFFRLPGPAGPIDPHFHQPGPLRPSLSPTGPPSTLTFTNRAPFDPHSHKPFPGWRPPGGLLRTAASGAAFFGPSPSDCVGPRCGGAIAGRSRPGVVSLGPRWHFLRPACRAR